MSTAMLPVKSGEIFRISQGQFSFLCVQCGLTFDDVSDILGHIDTHFDDSVCSEGDEASDEVQNIAKSKIIDAFNEAAKLENEVKTECDDIKVEALPFDEKEPLVANREKRIRRRKVKKPMSTEELDGVSGQKTIRRSEDATPASVESNEIDFSKPQECPVCQLHCENYDNYKSHLRVTHQMYGKVFQCYMCGLYCRNLNLLKTHLACTLHSKPNPNCYQCELEPAITNENDARPHKCFFCKQWFPNHLQFRKHFKNDHHQDVDKFFSKRKNCNEFTCYICQKDFVCKNYVKVHMKVHNENKAFVCDFCGQRYRTGAILRRHQNVHEGKTYSCDECGKTFGYYARLRIHRYSHRTELNHVCQVCSKAFKVQKYLAIHMLTHREEKKFGCRYCTKRFTFSTGRRAHEISQHNAV